MTTYYLNGTALQEGADFTLNGMTYPYAWLEGTSPSLRASLGIEKTGDINYDQKYYNFDNSPKLLEDREEVDMDGEPLYVQVWVETDVGVGHYENTDKRLITKGLKTTCLAEIKTTTNNLLEPTDYYIIRNHVESTEIPEQIVTYRAAVVTESARLQNAIPAVTSVEELITVMNSVSWPIKE